MPVLGGPAFGYSVATGQFTSAQAGDFSESIKGSNLNLSIWGTFVATVILERSYDKTLWLPMTYIDGSPISWSTPISTEYPANDYNAFYRFRCTSYTSGTINWRISQ